MNCKITNILYTALTITLFSVNGYAQNTIMKYRILDSVKFIQYIKDNHGKLIKNPYFKDCNFYECDNNTLVIENTIEKKATLYFDRQKYYLEMDKVVRREQRSPLKDKQGLIENIRLCKDELIQELFSELKVKRPENLNSTNLVELDSAIRKYGYENAYERLTLNLIVFSGEYIRETKGGYWLVQSNISYPSELDPVFIDSSGKRYDFAFNIQIQKQFLEKGKFKMADIIEFALLPQVFEAAKGPKPLH